MPTHPYDTEIDVEDRLVYATTHDTGERTEACAERVAEGDENGENWHVFAVDYRADGSELSRSDIGYTSHKRFAEKRLDAWMKQHPKGVDPGGNGGGVGGALERLTGGFGGD